MCVHMQILFYESAKQWHTISLSSSSSNDEGDGFTLVLHQKGEKAQQYR